MAVHRFNFLDINAKDYQEWLNLLDVKSHNKAVIRALNRTATSVRAEGKRAIRETYNIKSGDINLQITKAKGKPIARVRGSYSPISLYKFSARQTGRGVTVKVMKGGSRSVIEGSFIAQPKGRDWSRFGQKEKLTSPNPLVMFRLMDKSENEKHRKGFGKYKNRKHRNYPLRKRTGPSLGAMMMNDNVMERMHDKLNSEFPKNLKHEIQYIMMKRVLPEE